MFIEVINLETESKMLINLDHVTKITRYRNKCILTDIHSNKIVCLYTVELANIINRLKINLESEVK